MEDLAEQVAAEDQAEQFKMDKLMKKLENIKLKKYLRGKQVWNSSQNGAYIKSRDSEIMDKNRG